jgi:hypothetical protein
MDVSIKQFNCFTCEFDALQSGAVIKVEDVEVDNNALEHALKQIIDDHCLTQSAQRVCIRKFTVRQDDYEKLIGSNFFSAKLNGVAEPKGESYFYPCEVKIGKFALERIEDYNPDGAGTGELTFFDVLMILYNEGKYSAELDTRKE